MDIFSEKACFKKPVLHETLVKNLHLTCLQAFSIKPGFFQALIQPRNKKLPWFQTTFFLAAACDFSKAPQSFKIWPESRWNFCVRDALLQFEMCAEASHSLSLWVFSRVQRKAAD
jgi:hypothetical protein